MDTQVTAQVCLAAPCSTRVADGAGLVAAEMIFLGCKKSENEVFCAIVCIRFMVTLTMTYSSRHTAACPSFLRTHHAGWRARAAGVAVISITEKTSHEPFLCIERVLCVIKHENCTLFAPRWHPRLAPPDTRRSQGCGLLR